MRNNNDYSFFRYKLRDGFMQDQIGPSDSFFICFLLHLSGSVFLTIFSRVLIFFIVIFFTLI